MQKLFIQPYGAISIINIWNLIPILNYSELELQKARLETKKESIVKGRSQKKKELALTKRSLSELDGFSTKLEKLKRYDYSCGVWVQTSYRM